MFIKAAISFDAVSQKAWTFMVGGCFVAVISGNIPTCQCNWRRENAVKNSYAIQRVLEKYPTLSREKVKECLGFSTFVDVNQRFMFFEVPKAACTTMKALLHRMAGSPPLTYYLGEVQTRREMFVHCRRNVPLPSLVDLDDRTQEMVLHSPDIFRFAVVRNPYTRLISAWRSKVVLCEPGFEYVYRDIRGSLPASSKELITFPEFLDYVERSEPATYNPHWMLQTDHLFYDAFQFSYIGKMEKLSDALKRFQEHLGETGRIDVGSSNTTAYKDDVALTDDQANRIYRIYQNDFEKLGYDRADFPQPHKTEQSSNPAERNGHYTEILERNIIIGMIARERAELAAKVRWTPAGVLGGIGRKLRRLVGQQV